MMDGLGYMSCIWVARSLRSLKTLPGPDPLSIHVDRYVPQLRVDVMWGQSPTLRHSSTNETPQSRLNISAHLREKEPLTFPSSFLRIPPVSHSFHNAFHNIFVCTSPPLSAYPSWSDLASWGQMCAN